MPDGFVLVADDDHDLRILTSEILRRCGFLVEEAQDGEEVLDKLARREIDAVVLDVKMPRKDGILVVEEMSPEPPPPGVLLLTAYDIDHETRVRLGGRIVDILRKPIPPTVLIEAVSQAVEVAQSARSNGGRRK
ncbi:MAG TPA: response regulator [Acidimicrobiales bacterium]|nr:response regulator [Acidimicrobiales bacterium]